ncbi:MAG: ribonuclease HII, partial [Patescibacteria group bacterium]
VVAVAVLFDWSKPEVILDLAQRVTVRDSKTLSRPRRKEAAAAIREVAIAIGIAEVDAKIIDEINILQATLRAMREAVEMCSPPPYEGGGRGEVRVLVDGNQKIPHLDLPQETIIDGDAKIFSIAAASLVAKEYRDALMEKFDEEHPGYDFSSHKGYGTKKHVEAIRLQGLSPIHRISFWHG